MHVRILILLVSAASLLVGSQMAATHATDQSMPANDAATDGDSRRLGEQHRYLGAASCASAGCHAHPNPARKAPLGREYRVWVGEDPHSQSYATLLTTKSKQIASKLQIPNAHQAAECLSCHAQSESAGTLAAYHRHTIRDGVTCESCHGPAEHWISLHTKLDWKALSVSQRAAYGFRDTSDLSVRAKACVGCHVGSPGRDVNHDLIAAGHPPLHFELTAYLSKLPRHWSRAKDRLEHGAYFEAKLWKIGQLHSAAAALDQLANRAATASSPWPEFAEYDCFSCHQDLKGEENAPPGTYAWGEWHAFGLQQAAAHPPRLVDELNKFRALMRGPYDVVDRAEVNAAANRLRSRLLDAVEGVVQTNRSRVELRAQLAKLAVTEDHTTWSSAANRFLAIVSVRQSVIDVHGVSGDAVPKEIIELEKPLLELQELLSFPDNFESPHDFDQAKQRRIQELFRAVHDGLQAT